MNESEIERILGDAESAIRSGASLKGTGFWRAVSAVRGSRMLATKYAPQIGRIDRQAFEAGVRLRVPSALGTTLLAVGTLGGVMLVLLSDIPVRPLFRVSGFLVGFGLLLVSSHSLTHWLVGTLLGMRFTHYFIGGPPPPRPGAKTDYASYLLTAPRRRALMHASGAVVTKLIPIMVLPAGSGLGVGPWIVGLLVAIGIIQIVTDVLFSTKSSDWKKVARELKAAPGWH